MGPGRPGLPKAPQIQREGCDPGFRQEVLKRPVSSLMLAHPVNDQDSGPRRMRDEHAVREERSIRSPPMARSPGRRPGERPAASIQIKISQSMAA